MWRLESLKASYASLRRASHDYEQGTIDAIAEIRQHLIDTLKEAYDAFKDSSLHIQKTRWTFAFYGEIDIEIFYPAFLMGRALHTIQDSFTHTIRNDSLSILTVLNYADVVLRQHSEERDGPAHSERLDLCDIENNAFDATRFQAARENTAAIIGAMNTVLAGTTYDASSINTVLDSVYGFTAGCDLSTEYCNSEWYTEAKKEFTEPISISFCSSTASAMSHSSEVSNNRFWAYFQMVLLLILLRLGITLRRMLRKKYDEQ